MASGEEEVSRAREKNERQQQPELCTTYIVLHAQDVRQPIGRREESPPQPLGGAPTWRREDPQPPHIKGEDEELCITHEGLQRREEADLSKLPLTGVSVKTEEHDDKPDAWQLIDPQEEHPHQSQSGSSTLKQEDPQPPHIKKEEEEPQSHNMKEEEEELWVTREGERFLGREEADLANLPLTVITVKTEDREDQPPESSQLHHSPSEENTGAEPPSSSSPQRMTTEADGDHCGGSPARSLLAPLSDSDDITSHSPEDEDGDDTREALSSDPDCEGDMGTDDKHSKKKAVQ
ncbi:protein IWS1 homolog isoform X2 [Dunckerocampus dactyliophorus]|uniref:protein IWS1 homolog isoform X2 n=1 Tax=Dunckerocampus dactyliophorus TaxID=161453 RepID=UPI0024055D41|nr:protein IWS1 homolog isoform X2 [Dunckerocampus dactyliophorus]